ncbi:hypothetical protein F0L68_21600 [Solihabitans fulvus]|uniref:Tetratricopeptide repeat protein n=1 Tax=Solihabitans fulvus TaxID=1892852 RepID=A0A5B2X8P3_9PSEU|nr:hypothetical protein [Solihabitans fulvus]KAA2259523.1 hypothetical protein F0L68_21600 [Solihabitans fulvus]
MLLRPGTLLSIAVLAVIVPLSWDKDGVFVALLGDLSGFLLALAAMQLGILLGALAFGVRVHYVMVGVGAKVREWSSPRRRVVLRAIPLLFHVGIGPQRAPARRRMWLASIGSATVGLIAVGLCWLGAGATYWMGAAVSATATLAHSLLPRRTAGSTSVGWYLFRLPGLTGRPAAELDAAPLVAQTVDAMEAGNLDAAERSARQLADLHPQLNSATAARAALLNARGRYGEGLLLISGLMRLPDQQPREMAMVLAGMAGLAAAAVEAGQLEPDVGLPAAHRAADGAAELGCPKYRLTGTLGLLALLEGEPHKAISLATQGAELSDYALTRADDLATVARAHMAAGNNAAAREALAEAETLAAWWPRVAETRARLDIS